MAEDEQYEAARQRVEAKLGFAIHLGVYLVINIIFLIVVGWDFLWATCFWGLGVACHGAAVFFKADPRLREWKERAITKELSRERGEDATQPVPPAPPTPPTPPAPPTTGGTVG
jgi:hypothetical protein